MSEIRADSMRRSGTKLNQMLVQSPERSRLLAPAGLPGAVPGGDERDEGDGDVGRGQLSKSLSPPAPGMGGPPMLTEEELVALKLKYPHMNVPELHALEVLFHMWDEDGSGAISLDELSNMMSRLVRGRAANSGGERPPLPSDA